MHPVDSSLIAWGALAAGGIVFCGAAYAVLFALGQLGGNQRLVRLSFAGYAGLVACTWLLMRSLQLSGIWLWLVAALLVGYLVAPQLIWRLSVAVHAADASLEPSVSDQPMKGAAHE
jgi:hypothetical protein